MDHCLAKSGRDGSTTGRSLMTPVDAYYSKSTCGKRGNSRNCFRICSKGKKKFIAEVKSGKAASIEEINTRRQLLEYSKVFNNKNLILIDTEKNKIKKIEF